MAARFHNDLEIDSLMSFFTVPENISQLVDLLTRKTKVTRSLVDWFVTNYVKENDVEYIVDGEIISVNMEYKIMLGRFGKKKSDPFCRDNKFPLYTGLAECPVLHTSKKQLCFFKWAIQKHILKYVQEHYSELLSLFHKRERKLRSKKSCRKHIHKSDSIHVTYYKEPHRVHF